MVQPSNPVFDLIATTSVGHTTVLQEGREFEGKPEWFRTSLIHGLRRRGVRCQTRVSGREVHVTVTSKENEE